MDDTPQTLLRKIWSLFSEAQYTDEQEIIEYIAYLLTENQVALNDPLKAEKPRNRYGVAENKVRDLLKEADTLLQNEGGVATFFDRYVIFQSTRIKSKSTYPIPRHIVDFMLALLQIEPEHRFADFTCGTGGFLVNRDGQTNQHPGITFGTEIVPALARISHANALLHGLQNDRTTIEIGNAFSVFTRSEWHNQTFDRIAMAPPFGETIDAKLAEALLSNVSNRSSDLLFTRLALQKLAPEGEAIIMVSPGLGYTNASHELRKELVEQHTLKAVISLGPNILQPFTPMSVYLLLFANSKPTTPQPTWFLDILNDGYPLNPGRDLTIPPSISTDLPLAKAAILPANNASSDFQLIPLQLLSGVSNDQVLSIKPLLETLGAVLKIRENATLTSITFFQGSKKGTYLLVLASLQGRPPTSTLIPLSTANDLHTIKNIVDPLAWRREYFDLPVTTKEDEIKEGTHIFGRGISGQMIAITSDGFLLGFTKSPQELAEAQYELTNTYRKIHAEPLVPFTSTATMLQEIHTQQQMIDRYIDNLLGQLEVKHIIGQPLPPPLLNTKNLPLIDDLSTEQETIWTYIVNTFTVENNYALYFSPTQLPNYINQRIHIEQTLQLLECLGLLVQVTIKQPGKDTMIHCYRRTTRLDYEHWKNLERDEL